MHIHLEDKIPEVLKRAGSKPMSTVVVVSNNCGSQFKNRYIFFFIGEGSIAGPPEGEGGRRVPLNVEWHFWAACHGKNVSDSEGATLKNVMAEREKDGVWRLATTKALYEQCCDSQLSYFLRAATDEERQSFYQGNCDRSGHAQLLMTKVREYE